MATHVPFMNLATNEIKTIKVGWSWTLFLFGPILGVPFWMRKVYNYAAMMIGWNILCILLPDDVSWTKAIVTGGGIGISYWLGREGNKLSAQYYLKHGWELAEADSDLALYAREKWALG